MTQCGGQVALTILYTSDVHGYVLPLRYADNQPVELGLAKIATLIQDFRHRSENVILIDNGDVIQGTPLTYHHARVTPDLPNPIVQVMNELTYDAAVFGDHEFNYESQILQRVVHESKFPWLSANIVKAGTDIPYFGTPYLIRTLKCGVRVAVLGLTTQYIPNWENPAHIEGMDFLDAVDTCKRWVAKIRREAQPDVMVVAYHGGFERDVDTSQPTERHTGENQGYRLCSEVKGIDVLLTGHEHRALSGTVCGVTVIQPGCNAACLGKVDVLLQREGRKWNVVSKSAELVDVAGTAPDAKVVEVIRPYEEQTQVWLDQPIGRILGDMTVKDPMAIRLCDNPLIEFVNKVQMETAGVSISNAALFDNLCPGFPRRRHDARCGGQLHLPEYTSRPASERTGHQGRPGKVCGVFCIVRRFGHSSESRVHNAEASALQLRYVGRYRVQDQHFTTAGRTRGRALVRRTTVGYGSGIRRRDEQLQGGRRRRL